jgi:hypothetical protein
LNIILLILCALALIYSIMGIEMAYWIATVPGNTPQHICLNFIVWISASLITLVVNVYLAFRLSRRDDRQN